MFVKILLFSVIVVLTVTASGNENNTSIKKQLIQKSLQKAMEKEKKYAKEQKFYNADEYDFKGAEIDPSTLKDIETIKPDYDYTDDWGACDNN
ncbi:hypothetical protein MNB_SV-8-1243 [hydrothermal vent metagenome]|uniref:Uncharacterized protein n=1 Tax=hydrothermal vent metagenome TaxID=652676 RepID=A0A1W1C7W8_9ZZZZ